MRLVFTIILFLNCIIISAQNTTTVVVSGIGKTYIEAEHFAIRSALEQSFGGYISSNSTILNNILIKDEITTITNGNILEYKVLEKHKITDKSFTVTLEVTVSLDRLTRYVKANGAQVEFKGSNLFHEIKQMELNKKAELTAIENILPIINNNIYDYELELATPKFTSSLSLWKFNFKINFIKNSNYTNVLDMLESLLYNISLTNKEKLKYKKMDIPYYIIEISRSYASPGKKYSLRNVQAYKLLIKILNQFNYNILNFEIINNNNTPIKIGELKFNKSEKQLYYHYLNQKSTLSFPCLHRGPDWLREIDKEFYSGTNITMLYPQGKWSHYTYSPYRYKYLWLESFFSTQQIQNLNDIKIKPIITKNIIEKESNGNIIYYTQRDLESELKNEGYLSSDISKIMSGIEKSNFKPQEKIDYSAYDIDTNLAKQFNSILYSLINNKLEKKNFPFDQINQVNNINTLTTDKERNPGYDYENNFDYNIYNYSIFSGENSYVKILFDTTKTELFNNILSSQIDYKIIKITREKQWMTPIKIPLFTTPESADAGILDYTDFHPSLKETEFIEVHFNNNMSIKIFDAEKYLNDYIDFFISSYKILKVGNEDEVNYVINDNSYTEKMKAVVLYWHYLLKQTASGYEDMFIISEKY